MISGRDNRYACFKQFLGQLRRDSEASGQVLTVGNDRIDTVLCDQPRHCPSDSPAARLSHDVPDT
jgi:hypothetical protein